MLPFLALLVAALYGLARLEPGVGAVWPLVLTSLVSFGASGAVLLSNWGHLARFWGKRGSSTAAGLADTARLSGRNRFRLRCWRDRRRTWLARRLRSAGARGR